MFGSMSPQPFLDEHFPRSADVHCQQGRKHGGKDSNKAQYEAEVLCFVNVKEKGSFGHRSARCSTSASSYITELDQLMSTTVWTIFYSPQGNFLYNRGAITQSRACIESSPCG